MEHTEDAKNRPAAYLNIYRSFEIHGGGAVIPPERERLRRIKIVGGPSGLDPPVRCRGLRRCRFENRSRSARLERSRKLCANLVRARVNDGMVEVNMGAAVSGSADEIARIRTRIHDYFSESLANGVGRYFLARLGSQLGGDRAILEKLTGKKLVAFVQEDLGYELEREGAHGNVIVVKLGDQLAMPQRAGVAIPRYAPRFWAAFRVPLQDEDGRRFINLGTMTFGAAHDDVADNDGDVREIDAEFIVRGDGPAEPSVIAESIERWLAQQELEQGPFLIQRKDGHREERSLLDAMISALSGEQLKRVSLPLDVVKALSEQSA